jgi:hypothetical protein
MKADQPVIMTSDELRKVMRETVHETLLTVGVQSSDPIEMQKDFQHLRDWRTSTEAVKRKGLMTLMTIAFAGVIGAVVMAVKSYFTGP